MVDSVKKIPELTIFLIENAHELFDRFEEDGSLFPPASNNTKLHQSTDSGLSNDVLDEVPTTNSPDSFNSSSPPLSDSVADNSDYKTTPSIEELKVSTNFITIKSCFFSPKQSFLLTTITVSIHLYVPTNLHSRHEAVQKKCRTVIFPGRRLLWFPNV
jgi:hypothetical protein